MMEFIADTHTYLNDFGIIIPSVTQLISWKLGTGYDNVPDVVLKRKSEYGTGIHSVIEVWEKEGKDSSKTPSQKASLMGYKRLAVKLPKVKNNELMVCYDNRLAGQIDIVYEDNSLGDIKTYATLDSHALEKLKWQLSLYAMCLYGKDMDNYPKTGHLVYLPKSMKFKTEEIGLLNFIECIGLLEEYELCH